IAQGRPESVNAQGIARTEEMFLYFTDAAVSAHEAAKVLQGLNDESIRAVADPKWVTATGVFGDIHPSDPERYPDIERLYELTMTAPSRWVERLGFYGMWLHGDYPGWNINLPGRWVSPYRTLRKNHHAFPLRWLAYARSGDPRFLKLAENAARQMADANFCHFATAEVDESVGPDHFRRQGWWDRSLLPWIGRSGPHLRSYTVDSDYLWDTYYLTGYGRTRDVALLFGELTQHDHGSATRGRGSQSIMKTYLDMYQATYDPWFLNAAWEVADMHMHLYGNQEVDPLMTEHPREVTGFDHWRAADQAFYDYTGWEDYAHVARNSAVSYANPLMIVHRAGADNSGGANGMQSAYAWKRTGDPLYLARLTAVIDDLLVNGYEGEEMDYFLGAPHGGFAGGPNYVGRDIPMALAILSNLDEWPDPIHDPFSRATSRLAEDEVKGEFAVAFPEVTLRHKGEKPLVFNIQLKGSIKDRSEAVRYEVEGPDGFQVAGESRAPDTVELDVEEGDYRVRILASGDPARMRLFYPLSNLGTPEVFKFESVESGTHVEAANYGYWFHVPEGVESFWIEFTSNPPPRMPINRVSVWDPDGNRVWDQSYTGDPPERVEIAVSPEQSGKLWRATGGNFIIDPRIPPCFSVSRGRWFNPAE
ncbi:MAG: hypothetical protein LC725_07955, partial [Lentisphaerae bacterium]|nr:hypothetical protein [Lentisphaerota bacterium]